MGSLLVLCSGNSRKIISIPPRGRDPTTPLEIPISFVHFYIVLGLTETPHPTPPPRKFQSLLWGEYGYFLELHISARCDIQIELNK